MKKLFVIVLFLFAIYGCTKPLDTDISYHYDSTHIRWPYKYTLRIDSTLSKYPVIIDTL